MTDPHYPELTATDSLASLLCQKLGGTDTKLRVVHYRESIGNPSVASDEQSVLLQYSHWNVTFQNSERSIYLTCAADKRLFTCQCSEREIPLARVETSCLEAVAHLFRLWVLDRIDPAELAISRVVGSVQVFPCISAHKVVAAQWDAYHDHLADGHLDLFDFYQAAKATPELRQLFPFTSMWYLCFSRCTHYPFTRDCPHVRPKQNFINYEIIPGYYEVFLRERYLGEGPAERAAQIVVQYLPRNCGPAQLCTETFFNDLSEPH
ncbi:DUF6193 family natural product biosynthesis protein [Gimesia algae]|uniref:Uncharacterized protein n=1 Tax=Gimesia algae TaxID=2527971 RepID=A0A517VHX8_9PLAN|nr:DUF6193 family natural product biosynthesis protein [Gimesia algae]QDT92623.1 hypothetical protein Pan161_42910 [Gimesia algae]